MSFSPNWELLNRTGLSCFKNREVIYDRILIMFTSLISEPGGARQRMLLMKRLYDFPPVLLGIVKGFGRGRDRM